MPRYFFQIQDGSLFADEEGTELPDLEAARLAAVDIAGLLIRDDRGRLWDGPDWQLEVVDEHKRTVLVLTVSARTTG